MLSHLPDACTCCTACTVACPVAAVTTRFRGPKQVGPALERFRRGHADREPSLALCSGCRSCDAACPSGVPIASLNALAAARDPHRRHRLRDWVLGHGEWMGRLAVPLAPLANATLRLRPMRALLRGLGLGGGAPFPAYARRTFSARFRALPRAPLPEQVVLFPGCFGEYNQPEVGLDLVAVLRAAGIEVVVPPGLTCCGAPLVSNGLLDEAEDHARRNVRALLPYAERGLPIVTTCPTCRLVLGREVPELFSVEGSAAVAERTVDAAELLLPLLAEGRLQLPAAAPHGRVLYHAPCHQRAWGGGLPAQELLQAIPGLEVVAADAGCCGISGSYGFKAELVPIARAVGARLFARVAEVSADCVASECGTCRVQIAGGTGAPTIHPITLVRRALEARPAPQLRAVRRQETIDPRSPGVEASPRTTKTEGEHSS